MDKKTKQFLNVIRQIESSGGKNLNHKPMVNGLHAGTTAFGEYGLTPNTTKDVAARLKALNKLNNTTKPLSELPPEQINGYLQQNPQAEQQTADFLARNLLARMHGNQEKAGYAWNMGHNLQEADITDENLQNHPYVKKIQDISRQQALRKLTGQ